MPKFSNLSFLDLKSLESFEDETAWGGERKTRNREPEPPPPDELPFPAAPLTPGGLVTLAAKNVLVFAFHGKRIVLPKDDAWSVTIVKVRVAGANQLSSWSGLPGTMFVKDCVDFSFPALLSGESFEMDFAVGPVIPEGACLSGVKVLGTYRGA